MKAKHISVITLLLVALLTPCLHAATLDESFTALAKFKDGDSRVAVVAVEKAVRLASNDAKAGTAMASRLITLIESKSATIAAKKISCQFLPLVADQRAVKTLAALLSDPKMAESARGALRRIALPSAAKALRDATAKARGAATGAAKTLPVVMPAPRDPSKTNVLIVTGVDYPGHKWKKTAPVIAAFLAKDKRLEIQTVADPHQLSSATLHKYDVVVVHFMNWKVPAPDTTARENFSKFIENGGGAVFVHFACGAWQKWPGFVKIAGRVWNPKFRGHDRRGPFTVEIVGKNHEITKGMKDFETYDELYTCLDGKTAIDILAHAKSKADKKYHPMGFVLKFGKGRVFHSPLGHDVKAFEAPGVQELFRRGAAWAGKLKPVAPK